jgi:gliding motility-associated protein GldM
LVNEILSYVGGRVVKFDKFFPVLNAKKSYLIKGETFEAEVSIGSYSSSLDPKNVRVSVNGSNVSLDNTGKGKYTAGASEVGKKTLKLSCAVTNPLTGEVVNGEGQYEYEVGVRSVTVSADQMNVFYIGVDNPVTVAAAGVPTSSLKVSATGCTLKPNGSGKYIVTATAPGTAKITVSGEGLAATSFDFRVKRIPNPLACFKMGEGDYKTDGIIKSGVMGAQRGIFAELQNFDFNARCEIQSYTMYYTRARQDPVEVKATGAAFSGNALNAVQSAKPGDQYQFVDIKAKCPGDSNSRQVNGMAFQVK